MKPETKICEKCGHKIMNCDPFARIECWCGGLMYPIMIPIIGDPGSYMRIDIV